MKRIVIVEGGFSNEREVSLNSANEIYKALQNANCECIKIDPCNFPTVEDFLQAIRQYKADIVFNGLHGGDGENGNMQALFELAKLPFTGSGSLACKIAMDKYLNKLIAKDIGIKTPKAIIVEKASSLTNINLDFPPPYIVKPNNGGSSLGISKVEDAKDLPSALKDAFKHDDKVLIEEFIPGKELTVTILGDKTYPVIEVRPKKGWYDYQNKYTKGSTEYICPAEIPQDKSSKVQLMAYNLFKRISGKVYGRVDFRYDGKDFYFLEINTLPGMTSLSLTPMAVKAKGINFETLLLNIIDLSLSKEEL